MSQMEVNVEANKSPLCVFCLSPPFSVLPYQCSAIPAPRRPANASWRRGECTYPRIRPRFKPNTRRTSHALAKYLAGRVRCRKRDTISLQEVLNTLRDVWTSPYAKIQRPLNSSVNMDEKFRKVSCINSSDVSSPVLLRRRLSAPETIMRKHMLAQQRSDSQDSDVTQASDCRSCQWRMDVGSDSNLTRKRDTGLMRKSTLLRRLWGNGRPLLDRGKRFSGAYSEWQYSCGKLSTGKSTHSLNSNHSSPEHFKSLRSLSGEEFRTSPKHNASSLNSSRKVSPKHMYEINKSFAQTAYNLSSPRRKVSVYSSNCQDISNGNTYRSNFSTSVTSSATNTSTPKTTTTETESETARRTETSTTTYSDNSDSAYTNSQSNFTRTSNSNSETTYSSETHRYVRDDPNENNINSNGNMSTANKDNVNVKSNNNLNTDEVSDPEKFIKYSNSLNESSTQTPDTANLNVISNVQLSQSTLNLIFNQVLQDVQNKQPNSINIKTLTAAIPLSDEIVAPEAKVINVQQIPSFYLKRKEEVVISPEHNRIIKYMISNVGTGSSYSKPAEVPQVVVPRFSAFPRTTSMEVNTSSGDSTDKESDTVSLVDSLEDPMSPRGDQNLSVKHDDKPVRGDLSLLLPDNSDKKKTKTPQKPAAFFIPIENDKKEDGKSVADHLPAKVKEKLSKRQLKREQKMQQNKVIFSPRSDSNYISASDNGNHISFTVNNNPEYGEVNCPPDINCNKPKRKSKPLLPSIETIRKLKIDSKDNLKYTERERFREKPLKSVKRKFISKQETLPLNSKTKPTAWLPKSRQKGPEKLTPIYTTKNEYVCEGTPPRRIYHKTEVNNSNKRIEILEIMECVDDTERAQTQQCKTSKSKIPVLVQQKLPKIEKKPQRPIYLDFENIQVSDSKIDQLIANILIDTLNKCEVQHTPTFDDSKTHILKLSNEKRPAAALQTQTKVGGAKYQQKFEVIPEELSLQSSVEDNAKKTAEPTTVNGNIVESAAEILTKQVLKNTSVEENSNDLGKNISRTPTKETTKNLKGGDSYKGKAAISMVRDDNLSTIPQGWITFYMLHKSQGSPDSTSDEGTKKSVKLKTKEDLNVPAKVNCKSMNNYEDSHIKVQEKQFNSLPMHDYDDCKLVKRGRRQKRSLETMSSSDAFSEKNLNPAYPPTHNGKYNKHYSYRKNCSKKNCANGNEQNMQNLWSVTVSGSNTYGQSAPDVEMRLKFPHDDDHPHHYQCDTHLRQPQEVTNENFSHVMNKSCHLPKRHNLQQNGGPVSHVSATDDNFRNGRLPVISQSRSQVVPKRCDQSTPSSVVPAKLEPRQTKTSTRRYALTRPRNLPLATPCLNPEDFLNLNAEGQLAAILSRFPEILSINGNGISPERKPRVTTMSERDLTRNLYTNPR